MSDLAEFLLARIAEDEGLARPLAELQAMELRTDDEIANPEPDDGVVRYGDVFTAARVLAECAAKRQIIDHATYAERITEDGVDLAYRLGQWHGYKSVLRLLALPYADHPDYDETWRP